MLELQMIIAGAFFCYGIFTLQRKDFLLEGLKTFWKKFPKALHEPLFSCGVCVTSIWGTTFILSQFLIRKYVAVEFVILAEIPFYIISMCGICAIVDRAVKFFEVGYGYSVKNIPKTPDTPEPYIVQQKQKAVLDTHKEFK